MTATAAVCTMINATMEAVSTLPIGGRILRSGSTSGLVTRITACDSWLREFARASGSKTRKRNTVTNSTWSRAPTMNLIEFMNEAWTQDWDEGRQRVMR